MLSTGLSELKAALSDRYTIDREIAHGGMATVYLAHDVRHDRDVALKVMNHEVALTLGRERFLREIKLTAKLSHPNILTVHDSGEAGDYLWYVMPYVEGKTLRDLILEKKQLSVDEAVRYMREAADAVGYAHSLGIIHRDIKPENILLSRGHAVVGDFGIARAIESARDDQLTGTGFTLGTTAYMSPEQALGEDVDARSDVWALGCVMYELLAGKPPFGTGGREVVTRAITGKPEPIQSIRNDVPDNVEYVVMKAIARDRDDRFANASDLAAALDGARSGAIIVSRKKHLKRKPVIIAVAVVAIAVAGAYMMWKSPAASGLQRAGMSKDSVARELYRQAQAQAERRTGDAWARAISLYSQAIARDSSFALAWADLARTAYFAYWRASGVPGLSADSLRAISSRAADMAITLAPNDPATWLVKSRSARIVDPTDNESRLFGVRKALALDSMYVPAWFELGTTMQDQLNDSAALSAWLHAVRLDPVNTEALSFLGLHYLWTGEFEKGIKWGDSAVHLDPTYPLARDATGQLTFELGRIAESQRQYEAQAQITKGREQGNSFAMLARVLAARSDTTKAREYLKRAMAAIDTIHPNRHETVYMGSALAAMGDTVGAVRFIAKYEPREDLHFQLHLKRDPGLKWLKGKWGKNLLLPGPQ
jgi:tRNA A-37 threonylcarbamoyl transferase component Bud32/tetratricopeptide (TPR) repeat protein